VVAAAAAAAAVAAALVAAVILEVVAVAAVATAVVAVAVVVVVVVAVVVAVVVVVVVIVISKLHCFVFVLYLRLCSCPVFRRVRKTAKSDYQLCHVSLYVRSSAWNNSAPSGQSFMKFDIRVVFENLSRNPKCN